MFWVFGDQIVAAILATTSHKGYMCPNEGTCILSPNVLDCGSKGPSFASCVCTKTTSFLKEKQEIVCIYIYIVQRVLRWFRHVVRMDEYRMARRVLMAKVSGGRVRGRPRLGWMDGVKVALGNRGMTVEAARKIEKSGEPWYICDWMSFTRPFLLGTVFFRKALTCSGGYHQKKGGIQLHDAVVINCGKRPTTENQGSVVKYMG